ncbi:MerR family transcriptional regulator, partial [Actinomadura latina]|nr:MerR family transcriptional regulator [Actinomadura latina]
MDDTSLGIGDLAALTGVSVRTIRFYCDEGVLEPGRSAGGHRRFDRSAVDRLRLVRRLRALGLGLPAIAAVLAGDRSLAEAVAAERRAADAELASLAWRRASLILQPNVFQVFHPIGGVRPTPLSNAWAWG